MTRRIPRLLAHLATIALLTSTISAQAQNMRPVEELISNDPAWPMVQQWLAKARNHVQVLDSDKESAKIALHNTQVTTRSPLGAIVYETGGILVDHGVIRILGSGNSRMGRGVPDWNLGKSFTEFGSRPSFLLVGDDVFGGFFALNGGAFRDLPLGCVAYFSPRTMQWERLSDTYSEFLSFAFNGDLNLFYADMKWNGSDKEARDVDPQKAFHFYPPLWSKEGSDISKVTKTLVSESETWTYSMQVVSKLNKEK